MNEKNMMIPYNGNQITLISDEKDDYISLTDMVKSYPGRNIATWLKNKHTLQFLAVWEKKHNTNFSILGFEYFMEAVKGKNFSLSVEKWVEKTQSKGIFSRFGSIAGTYAHKDIAIKFAGWLSPEFELHIVEELQRLKKLEEKKNSFELLTHEQVIRLVQLKEVFKYVAHQEQIENAHRDIFAAESGSQNPFAEFHKWRNEILDIKPQVIDDRIKQYCIDKQIALTKKILSKPKHEKILMLDTYEAVRNAVWDFLSMNKEVNALNLADLVEKMIRTEKGEVFRKNEDNLFQQKQSLGSFSDFDKLLSENPRLKTAREVLAYREELKKKSISSEFNNQLKGLLAVPPPS
jgi:KilA-N domain